MPSAQVFNPIKSLLEKFLNEVKNMSKERILRRILYPNGAFCAGFGLSGETTVLRWVRVTRAEAALPSEITEKYHKLIQTALGRDKTQSDHSARCAVWSQKFRY
jgi:hypothetical protein